MYYIFNDQLIEFLLDILEVVYYQLREHQDNAEMITDKTED